jgi:hypothetical protein
MKIQGSRFKLMLIEILICNIHSLTKYINKTNIIMKHKILRLIKIIINIKQRFQLKIILKMEQTISISIRLIQVLKDNKTWLDKTINIVIASFSTKMRRKNWAKTIFLNSKNSLLKTGLTNQRLKTTNLPTKKSLMM